MEQTSNGSKITGAVAIVLFLGATVWGLLEFRTIRSMSNALRDQQLTSESYLSEKLFVQKDLERTEEELRSLEEMIKNLEDSVNQLTTSADSKDALIANLRRETNNNRKKYQQLESLRKELEDKLAILNGSVQQLSSEKAVLESQIAALEGDNQRLHDELSRARFAYFDMPLVEPLGNSDKLMVKARRTKRLKATVLVPSSMKEVTFRIHDPEGIAISSSPENGTLAVRRTEADSNLTSSTEGGFVQSMSSVEMTFISRMRLTPGVYQIEVLSENLPVGNLQLRLR